MANAYHKDHTSEYDFPSSRQVRVSSISGVIADSTPTAPPSYTPDDPLKTTSQNMSNFGNKKNHYVNQRSSEGDYSGKESLRPLSESPRRKRKVSILFMGDTGCGKSSFISKLTRSSVKVGHGLSSSTTESEAWDYDYEDLTISLIDTPGFDDTTRSEMEILDSIATFIMSEDLPPIIGVVYMHRITERRVMGSSRLNLDILRAMCGPEYAPSLVLTTTMWDTAAETDLADLKRREKELNNSSIFWGDLITDGATYAEYLGTLESSQAIIEVVISHDTMSPTLQIMLEMQNGVAVEDTTAGQVLTAELRRRAEKLLQEQLEDEEAEERRLRDRVAELGEETRYLRESQAREIQVRESQVRETEEQWRHRQHRRRSGGRRSRTMDESPTGREQPGVGFRVSFTGLFSRT